jgi:membrane protease YdiL (CAAX protease family)
MRAAVLGNLIPAMGFARANVFASIYFLLLHIPGWYMMGSLEQKLSQPIGGALSIVFLGLLFGWATQKGKSFLGGSIAHCLNNFAS